MSPGRLGSGVIRPRVVGAAVIALLCAGSAVWAVGPKHAESSASRAAPPVRYVCAWRQFGAPLVLHRARSVNECAAEDGLPVDLVADRQVYVCRALPGAGRVPAGVLRLVDDPGGCRPQTETRRSLPRPRAQVLCALEGSTRFALRWPDGDSGCSPRELLLTAPPGGQGPQARIVARDDSVTTSEKSPVTVNAVANDDAGLPLRHVRLTSTSAVHPRRVTSDARRIRYDPRGSFDALKAGELAHDSVGYLASDRVHVARARLLVTVKGVNDLPRLAGAGGGTLQVPAGPWHDLVATGITISDVDQGEPMTGATVAIADGFDSAHHDTLRFDPQPGISGSYDSSTGVLTLTGSASKAAYEQALRSVSFGTDVDAPASDPSTHAHERTISFRVRDAAGPGGLSRAVERKVAVTTADATADPALTPSFSPGVSDYAVRCTSGDPVDVSVTAPGTEISVDGGSPTAGSGQGSVSLGSSEGFAFTLTHGDGSVTYHVRCLPTDFPQYAATVQGDPQAEWFFVTPTQGATNSYVAAFNADGVPVWWTQAFSIPFDFKLLSNGNLGWLAHGPGTPEDQFNEVSPDGTLVRTTVPVNAFTDFHDYQELPNGDRYMLGLTDRKHVDVSAFTGKAEDTDADVVDSEVQELAPDGSLVWRWNSADHIPFSETGRWWQTQTPKKLDDGRNQYDITHINAVEPDGDGVIISLRHTDAIYRIVKSTGAIDWALGGIKRAESLTIVGDDANAATDFGGQHDPRRLPDGTVTVHDNGSGRGRPPRALRFAIDTAARTATLVETVTDPDVSVSGCCGSARKLAGGDWVMSWGQNPLVTELAPDGSRPFKLTFTGAFSYRANPVPPGVLAASTLRAGMDAMHPR